MILILLLVILGFAVDSCYDTLYPPAAATPKVAAATITPPSALLYADNLYLFAVTVETDIVVVGLKKTLTVYIDQTVGIDDRLHQLTVDIQPGKKSGSQVFLLKCTPARPWTLVGDGADDAEDEASFEVEAEVVTDYWNTTGDGVSEIDCIAGTHPGTSSGSIVIGEGVIEIPGYEELVEESGLDLGN